MSHTFTRTYTRTLIGLHSKGYQAGKDTAFKFIEEWAVEKDLVCRRRGFADYMKQVLFASFGAQMSLPHAVAMAEQLKKDETVASLAFVDDIGGFVHFDVNGRQFMQNLATALRDIVDKDIWVQALLAGSDGDWHRREFNNADLCIVADLRLKNEAKRIKAADGHIWKIEREGHVNEDDHESEAGLPDHLIDAVVYNTTLDEFRTNIRRELEKLSLGDKSSSRD